MILTLSMTDLLLFVSCIKHYTHAILTHSSISMDNFIVNMNPTVHLGYAIDALLQQKEAWSNAKSPPPTGAVYFPVNLT